MGLRADALIARFATQERDILSLSKRLESERGWRVDLEARLNNLRK